MKTVSICRHKIDLYWKNLSLLVVPIILSLTFVYEDNDGRYYVPISCGVSALIVFLNFPFIVILIHSRPIYFDDLLIKNYDGEGHIYDESFRKKYQNIFKLMASISSAVMIALTVELWFYRDRMFGTDETIGKDNNVNTFVVLGVISGLLRIYYGATMMLGRLLLALLTTLKKRAQERLRKETEDRTLIELSSVGVTIVAEGNNAEPLIQRTSSHNDMSSMVIGLKPTIMMDIFN